VLLANPHYPWDGVNRFWEKHLTIPGKLNVYGVGLMAAPGVVIGFNDNVGWTHTVSNSQRVAVYKLDLVPGKPTSYYYDGKEREMTSRAVDVKVKGADGTVSTKSFTIWFSHYGPMITMPGFAWTDKVAYSVRDINTENVYTIRQWMAMATSKNMDEFIEASRTWNAMPWVNTVAASKDGRALYMDNSGVGNLSDEALKLWQEKLKSDPLTKMVFTQGGGMPLLDGSDSRFEFQIDPTTTIKGTVPFDRKPRLERSDYVFNCNDSYWLANVEHPLTGYPPFYGPAETARSMRTRECAKLVSDTSAAGHAGTGGKFSIHEIQEALFANESLTANLLLPELLEALKGVDSVAVGGETVDLRDAPTALAEFNGHLDLDSKGAVLFREWLTSYGLNETLTNNQLFKVPFDPADPVNTPRGLGDTKVAIEKVGHAVQVLKRAGLALDATLGETQFAYRHDARYPIHGGGHHDGVANLQATGMGDWRGYKLGAKKIEGSATLTDKGYPVIHGSSFILTLTFDDKGPVGEALLSYSQSDDPASEHYADQTKLYSEEKWRPVRFHAEDIKAHAVSTQVLTGARK
jgi:acyl-homoserine-lactone acylase